MGAVDDPKCGVDSPERDFAKPLSRRQRCRHTSQCQCGSHMATRKCRRKSSSRTRSGEATYSTINLMAASVSSLSHTLRSDTFLVLILLVIFIRGVGLSPTPLTQAKLAGSVDLVPSLRGGLLPGVVQYDFPLNSAPRALYLATSRHSRQSIAVEIEFFFAAMRMQTVAATVKESGPRTCRCNTHIRAKNATRDSRSVKVCLRESGFPPESNIQGFAK